MAPGLATRRNHRAERRTMRSLSDARAARVADRRRRLPPGSHAAR